MLFLETLCDSGKTLFDISVNTGQICKHIFLREWVQTAKGVNTKMDCISYYCVFNLFPYDPSASRMKLKAYHYQDLFFLRRLFGKNLDILKMNGFT